MGTVLVVVLVVAAGWWLRKQDEQSKPVDQLPSNTVVNVMNNPNFKIEDLVVGKGAEATAGATISVNYRGTLTDGKEFDSSYKRNQPFSFILGQGQVIEGWDKGFVGMKVGGKRKLTIPAEMGYGERGAGADIPPNSTLIFEVELLEVSK